MGLRWFGLKCIISWSCLQHCFNTVDGQNPAQPRMMIIPLFTWFYTSQVVSRISSINSIIVSLKLGEMIPCLTLSFMAFNWVGNQDPPQFSASSRSHFWGEKTWESDAILPQSRRWKRPFIDWKSRNNGSKFIYVLRDGSCHKKAIDICRERGGGYRFWSVRLQPRWNIFLTRLAL